MNQTVDSRKYYPTALALYITYFVLGIAATIMGQYKQNFAALWGASTMADGSYDVSSVVAVIAAIGLGRLVAFPIAGPLSDRLGRRLSALIGCALYAVFLLGITFAPNLYVGYVLAVVSGMANSFLDTSITPSCMEIFKEKGDYRQHLYEAVHLYCTIPAALCHRLRGSACPAFPHHLHRNGCHYHCRRRIPRVPALPAL